MTAKGSIFSPMMQRTLTVEAVRRVREVGVSKQDNMYLLGVDFFEGLDYMIDSSKSCIYVWSK